MQEQEEKHYQDTLSVFDQAATEKDGYYDATDKSPTKHTLPQQINRHHVISLLNSLGKKYSLQSCLDAGCGRGDFTDELYKRYSYQRIRGIDVSDPMLKLANASYAKDDTVSFSKQDLSKPFSFADEEFDLSLCLNVIHHILPAEQEALIGELCRVSKHMVILEIKRFHFIAKLLTGYKAFGHLQIYPMTIADVTKYFQNSGYQLVKTKPIFYIMGISPITLLAFSKTK